MDWPTIIEEYIELGVLNREDAESYKVFLNSDALRSLHGKKCDPDFVAYLVLRYGYSHVIKINREDVNKAVRAIRALDLNAFKYFTGINRKELLKGLEAMKAADENIIFKSPVTARFIKKNKGAGRYAEWQTTDFVNFVAEHFRKTLGGTNRNLILDIMEYLPHWVEGRKKDRDNSTGELTELERLKKYLMKKPQHFEEAYSLIMMSYNDFKEILDK